MAAELENGDDDEENAFSAVQRDTVQSKHVVINEYFYWQDISEPKLMFLQNSGNNLRSYMFYRE